MEKWRVASDPLRISRSQLSISASRERASPNGTRREFNSRSDRFDVGELSAFDLEDDCRLVRVALFVDRELARDRIEVPGLGEGFADLQRLGEPTTPSQG